VDSLPEAKLIEDISIASPTEIIAQKIISYYSRRGQPKSGTDWRDLAMLLLTFPELKTESGPVLSALRALDANEDVIQTWRELVTQEIREPAPDSEFE
jgi:hypothetical protein